VSACVAAGLSLASERKKREKKEKKEEETKNFS
jgi:hypothetical protein